MSRLITLLLLYRAGYFVGKFISIEKLIEDSEQTYYEALNSSSNGWLEGCNDYAPFVRYILGIVAAEEGRERTEKSFLVPKSEIVANDYDLSVNKYKKAEYKPVEYAPTSEILTELNELELDITAGLAELEDLLGE